MSFQSGDYIRCNLDDQYLTVGKIYQVIKISESAEMVEITSDIGMNYFYPIVCFCPANKTMQFLPDDFPANKFDEMVKESPYYKEKFESVIEVINVSDTHLEVIGSFDDSGIKEGVKYKIIMQEIIE